MTNHNPDPKKGGSVKLEVKLWFGVDEDATDDEGWMVCDSRKDVGNYDIVLPKTITLTIPDSDDGGG